MPRNLKELKSRWRVHPFQQHSRMILCASRKRHLLLQHLRVQMCSIPLRLWMKNPRPQKCCHPAPPQLPLRMSRRWRLRRRKLQQPQQHQQPTPWPLANHLGHPGHPRPQNQCCHPALPQLPLRRPPNHLKVHLRRRVCETRRPIRYHPGAHHRAIDGESRVDPSRTRT